MTFTVEWVWFSGFSDWYSEWYSKFRFSVLIWICLQRENCIAACMMGVEFTAVRACYHTITKMIMILIIRISQIEIIHFKYFTFLEQVWQFDYHPMRSLLRFSIFRIVARQSRQDLIQEVANWVAIAIQFACCIWSYHQALLYGHCNCTLCHSKKIIWMLNYVGVRGMRRLGKTRAAKWRYFWAQKQIGNVPDESTTDSLGVNKSEKNFV